MVNIQHSQRSRAAGKQLRSWPTFDDDAVHVVHMGKETQQRAGSGHGVSGIQRAEHTELSVLDAERAGRLGPE